MTILKGLLGVGMFAAAAALLYLWGLKKSLNQQEDMSRALLHACGSKVVRYLKKHPTISRQEVARVIEGTTVHPLWSRNRMTVKKGKDFAPQVITFLLDQQYIQADGDKGFRLKP